MDKLKFTPTEGHVILDFNKKNSKITPNRAIDIALRILEKQDLHDLNTYFIPIYDAMTDEMANNYKPKKKEEIEEPEIA